MRRYPGEINTVYMVLLSLFHFAVLISTATGIDLDSLLIETVGGREAFEKLAEVTSYHAEGTVFINSQQGHFVMEYASPDRVYLQVSIGELSLASAYDGKIAWQQDFNGAISQLGGFEERELVKQAYFQSYSYLYDDRLPGGKEYRETATIDNRPCHVVALFPLHVDTVLVYIDVETGLQRLSVSRLDDLKTRTYSSDYRPVGGILMPFVSRAEAVGAPIVSEFVVDTVILNPSVDSLLFKMPADGRKDFRFPESVSRVTIPFEFRAGHIYVKATVNGTKKVRLILDSGASANIFQESALDDLDLPVVGSIPARGIGGYEEVSLVRTDSVNVGRLTLLNQVAGLADLPIGGPGGKDAVPFGGVLGFDFLSRFPVMIDYSNRILTVYDPEKFELPDGGNEIPFHLTMQVPTIRAELIGVQGDFLIDLGNAYGLVLHRKFVEEHGLDSLLGDIQPLARSMAGVGGAVRGNSAFAASFAFGDIRIYSLRVVLPEAGEGLTGSEELAGNIGNLLLERFRLLFDYSSSRLVFYERVDDPN